MWLSIKRFELRSFLLFQLIIPITYVHWQCRHFYYIIIARKFIHYMKMLIDMITIQRPDVWRIFCACNASLVWCIQKQISSELSLNELVFNKIRAKVGVFSIFSNKPEVQRWCHIWYLALKAVNEHKNDLSWPWDGLIHYKIHKLTKTPPYSP